MKRPALTFSTLLLAGIAACGDPTAPTTRAAEPGGLRADGINGLGSGHVALPVGASTSDASAGADSLHALGGINGLGSGH